MVNFQDIIKKSAIKMFDTSGVGLQSMAVSLIVALLCGLLIFGFYKAFYKGVVYSHNFNVLLVMITMITAFIIMTISSNIVLSLGMVGALSIVRFRAAIKDPMDIGFLFWAVAAGIASGAGLYVPSIVVSLIMGIVYALLMKTRTTKRVYLLVIKYDNVANENVQRILDSLKYNLKNKIAVNGKTELILEMKLIGVNTSGNTSFVTQLSDLENVHSAVLVEYSSDYGE